MGVDTVASDLLSDVLASQILFAIRQRWQGVDSVIDDFRPCIAHRLPINRCETCWPVILLRLGQCCATDAIRERVWIQRDSLSKPTLKEQAVFARQLRLA